MNHEAIVKIHSPENGNFGTGFVFKNTEDSSFVLTCGHVIKNLASSLSVDNQNAEVVLSAYEEGLDLAVIKTTRINCTPFRLSDSSNLRSLTVTGYTTLLHGVKKESIKVNDSKKIMYRALKDGDEHPCLRLYPNEKINQGYSGSPVIKDDGTVAGIVTLASADNSNYALCIENIDRILVDERIANAGYHKRTSKMISSEMTSDKITSIHFALSNEYRNSLRFLSTINDIEVEPNLFDCNEYGLFKPEVRNRTTISDIVKNAECTIIYGRPQYGLTVLAKHLCLKSFDSGRRSFWLYIDAKEIKPYDKEIKTYVETKLSTLDLKIDDISCIVLDEVTNKLPKVQEIIDRISSFFNEIPLVIMYTNSDTVDLPSTINFPQDRSFNKLYLWPLTRNNIRNLVSTYNAKKYISDEEAIVNRIVTDLDVLNMPRTVLNCLTILRIYEVEFDDSPINRTEMIRRVLSLLFNTDSIPSYKTKPDLKDTEYVLGFYCEKLIQKHDVTFLREDFLSEIRGFCSEHEIDLDTDIIFDILYENSILVHHGNKYRFKFSYWAYYFAAQRMHQSDEFMNFMFENMNYISYPEIIEFYTGIDRRRDNALEYITNDLISLIDVTKSKFGFKNDFDIYHQARWEPSADMIEKMDDDISSEVMASKLPSEIKDQYADKQYNYCRPLDQQVHKILDEYAVLRLMKCTSAASKALRNSDYTTPKIRHDLLNAIFLSWRQIVNILVALSPIIACNRRARIDGAIFILDDSFNDDDPRQTLHDVLFAIPENIVGWYKDDLFSKKMSSLLYKHYDEKDDSLIKHTMMTLIIQKRPNGWYSKVADYITNVHKNSFYLRDIYFTLRAEYTYGFINNEELKELELLIKSVVAKHSLGVKKPGSKVIAKIKDDILPERSTEN
ncbi:trypsin-like peptidase domain-containing protein [Aeromonas veronii]